MNSSMVGMKSTKRILVGLCLAACLLPGVQALALSATDWHMEPMEPNLQDLPSLQNGWRLYVN